MSAPARNSCKFVCGQGAKMGQIACDNSAQIMVLLVGAIYSSWIWLLFCHCYFSGLFANISAGSQCKYFQSVPFIQKQSQYANFKLTIRGATKNLLHCSCCTRTECSKVNCMQQVQKYVSIQHHTSLHHLIIIST